MKKALSLLLALLMCLSLCACGSKNKNITPGDNGNNTTTQSDNNTPQSAYVGEWKANVLVGNSGNGREYAVAVIQLNADGTGTYSENEITWEYSAEQNTINFTVLKTNTSGAFQIKTTDGKITLNFFQDTYYRAAEFEESNG